MNNQHFMRQLTPAFGRRYCTERGLQLPAELVGRDGAKASGGIALFVINSDDSAAQVILSDIDRCVPLCGEHGQEALSSAIRDDAVLVLTASKLANPQERAVWALVEHPSRFERAEAFLFADYRTEGRLGRDYMLAAGLTIACDASAHTAFAAEVGAYFRSRDGSGRSCQIELAPREDKGSEQVTIFVEGLPTNNMQAVGGSFKRMVTRPTIEAAAIYTRADGRLTIVARGGRPVHDTLHQAFARTMLVTGAGRVVAKLGAYRLDRLVPHRALPPIPASGIIAARVRRLRLRPRDGSGALMVEAPPGQPHLSVFDLSNRWFADGTALLERFAIDGATITLHYAIGPGRVRAKAINIEITRTGTSNVKRLPRKDRDIAEAHLAVWGLMPGV